MIIVLLFVES